MRRRSELGAGGATAGGEVEALGVEPDRPPAPGTGSPGGGLVPRQPREPRSRKRVHLREELVFGLDERRSALARGGALARCEGSAAPDAAVEMHVVDPELVKGEIGEAGIEASLWISLQIPDLSPRRGGSLNQTTERHARLVERVPAFMAPSQQKGGARVAREVPRMARQRRHQEQGLAVEIAGDAEERGER